MSLRFLVLIAALLTAVQVHAATVEQIMASRYLRAMLCTQRALGQNWAVKHGVVLVVNRYGISEPTAASMQGQTEKVLRAEGACRKANELQDERRP